MAVVSGVEKKAKNYSFSNILPADEVKVQHRLDSTGLHSPDNSLSSICKEWLICFSGRCGGLRVLTNHT